MKLFYSKAQALKCQKAPPLTILNVYWEEQGGSFRTECEMQTYCKSLLLFLSFT